MQYISGLNGVRAIAVLFVIIWHWFPKNHILNTFPLGDFGVDMFFVLSGFLISRILLAHKKEGKNKLQIFKAFLYRRFIRIFPIYYLTLFFLYLTKNTIGNDFAKNINWYIFYASNYLVYYKSKWFGALGHFWSLAVEEQFYLFWPIILLFLLKKKNIILTGVLFIIIGTAYPFFVEGLSRVLTISCLNTFGLGIILAYVDIFNPKWKSVFLKYVRYASIFMSMLIAINYLLVKIPHFSHRLAMSIIAIQIIAFFRYSKTETIIHKIFTSRILNFFGLISYGLYLYHNLLPKYWIAILSKLNISTPYTENYAFTYWEKFLMFIVLVLISYISWILIEKPILKLKKHFNY